MAANLHSALDLFAFPRQQTRFLYLEDGSRFLGNAATFPLHTARRQNAVLFKWQVGTQDLLHAFAILRKADDGLRFVRPLA